MQKETTSTVNRLRRESYWLILINSDGEHQPLEAMKGWSMVLFPTGVAGRDRDACTAESVLSMSRVGELGADILTTSVVLSRTANSCRKSTWTCTFCTDKPEQTEMECFVQIFNLIASANILISTEKHACLISRHYKNPVRGDFGFCPEYLDFYCTFIKVHANIFDGF